MRFPKFETLSSSLATFLSSWEPNSTRLGGGLQLGHQLMLEKRSHERVPPSGKRIVSTCDSLGWSSTLDIYR